jgi:hypothetical protein
MTEVEWLAATDPTLMQKFLGQFLGSRMSDRKLRLFSCACCRRVWNFVRSELLESALDTLERYVDGAVSKKRLSETGKACAAFRDQHWDETGKEEEICVAGELLNASTTKQRRQVIALGDSAAHAYAWAKVGDFNNRLADERACQSLLLRDIFGNPFRRVSVDPAWLTSTVVALANGIYAERAFDRMPILADALQDAGCDNDDVLTHCRGDGPHVRGCWVVDMLLGKT